MAALLAPGRSSAADAGAAGLLWLPDGATPPMPMGVVIALHDSTGIGARGWHYGEQLTAAGIAVLHLDLLEDAAGRLGAAAAADDATAARARLATVIGLLAEDPRFATAPVGLLAFGDAGQFALRVAADPPHGERISRLALLYPGCAALAAAAATGRARPLPPVLLLHGDADPANLPADCTGLAAQLARSAPVHRTQLGGAGYAWDLAPHGPHERMKLPWPGRPGLLVAASYWPEAVELAATQVAAFFAAGFAAPGLAGPLLGARTRPDGAWR